MKSLRVTILLSGNVTNITNTRSERLRKIDTGGGVNIVSVMDHSSISQVFFQHFHLIIYSALLAAEQLAF